MTGSGIVSGDGFSLAYSNCSSLEPNQSCLLKILFNSTNKNNGVYSGKVIFETSEADLSAALNIPESVEDLKLSAAGIPVDSELDFGVIKYNQSVIKTLKVENNSSDTFQSLPITLSTFVLAYDSCSGTVVKPKGSCQLKVVLNGAGKQGLITESLSIGQKTLILKANVKNFEMVDQEESNIKLMVNNEVIEPGFGDLGTWNLTNQKLINLYFKNMGSAAGKFSTTNIISGATPVYSSCVDNYVLNPGSSCIVKMSTPVDNKGTFNIELLANNQNYNLQYIARSPGDKIQCEIDNSQSSSITWDGTSYSQCQVEICNENFHLNNNTCESNTATCLVDNGSGIKNWVNNSWGQCQVNDCDDEFTIVNNQCVPASDFYLIVRGKGSVVGTVNGQPVSLSNSQVTGDTNTTISQVPIGSLVSLSVVPDPDYHFSNWEVDQSGSANPLTVSTTAYMAIRAFFEPNIIACTGDNGTGQRTWNNNAYGDCILNSCSVTHHLNTGANTCDLNVISCNGTNGTGTQTWNGTAYGSCLLNSCLSTHHLNTGANTCDLNVISCNIDNGTGTQTWNGSSYGSCTVTSCNTNYHQSGNSCVPNVQACSGTNGTGTQTWTGTAWGVCTLNACSTNYMLNTANNSCDMPNSCLQVKNLGGTTSKMYNITPPGKPLTTVYCDQSTNGGGYTVFPVAAYGNANYVNWSTYRTDTSTFILYMKSGGTIRAVKINQLPNYASTPLGISFSGTTTSFSFVPGVTTGKLNGFMYNNNSAGFTNCDGNNNSYMHFSQGADGTASSINTTWNTALFNTGTDVSSSFNSYYSGGWGGGAFYFGGCGSAMGNNTFNATQWIIGIK